MNEPDMLNKNEAIERLGGDEEIYLELLKTFLDVYKNDEKEAAALKFLLQGSAEKIIEDTEVFENVRKEAHKIKGAAYTVGANLLGHAALAIEAFFKDGNTSFNEESSDRLQSLLKEFSDIYEKTIMEIAKCIS